jgi:hypothetical protein
LSCPVAFFTAVKRTSRTAHLALPTEKKKRFFFSAKVGEEIDIKEKLSAVGADLLSPFQVLASHTIVVYSLSQG